MGLFSRNTKVYLSVQEEAQLKVSNALGMFSTAIADIQDANHSLEHKKQSDLAIIESLTAEYDLAEQTIAQNTAILGKLTDLVTP